MRNLENRLLNVAPLRRPPRLTEKKGENIEGGLNEKKKEKKKRMVDLMFPNGAVYKTERGESGSEQVLFCNLNDEHFVRIFLFVFLH